MTRLLIIDDDADIRLIVKMVLERSGAYQVVEADSGARAVELLRQATFDVLLLDYLLPDGTGLELLEKLQQEQLLAGIAVIILTARKDPELGQALRLAGARGMLHKPFDPGQLQVKLEEFLGLR